MVLPGELMGIFEDLEPMTDPAISVRNVSVAFGGRAILKNVSFDVPRGTTLAVMGLSGVGKSTTLRCLVGLQKPDSGEIYINGKNILKMDDKEFDKMRRRIGMVFQSPALFDSLTIGENVAFGLREHTKLPEEEIQRIVAVGQFEISRLTQPLFDCFHVRRQVFAVTGIGHINVVVSAVVDHNVAVPAGDGDKLLIISRSGIDILLRDDQAEIGRRLIIVCKIVH